jgi:glycosyltransferase involved in cell wall biosynthesis
MDQVLYDARWIGNHGIGRFADELQKRIPNLLHFQAGRRPWHPFDPILLGLALTYRKPRLFFSPGYNSPLGWRGPFVFTLHDLNHLCVRDNSNVVKRAYYHTIIKPACHRASVVLTVSDYSKQEICEWAKVSEERVINVGNGVGEPFTPSGRKYEPGYPYLFYAGSHKVHKNLPRLLSAYAAAGVRNDVRLVLTGMPDVSMSKAVSDLGLEQFVSFVGFPNNHELATYYRGAAGFVFPSLYEGFGLPPLEAMACGTPVLTSNRCSLPEIVGDAGLLVDPEDVEAIAEGIRTLVGDTTLAASLREKGFEKAGRFTWEKTAASVVDALQTAMSDM